MSKRSPLESIWRAKSLEKKKMRQVTRGAVVLRGDPRNQVVLVWFVFFFRCGCERLTEQTCSRCCSSWCGKDVIGRVGVLTQCDAAEAADSVCERPGVDGRASDGRKTRITVVVRLAETKRWEPSAHICSHQERTHSSSDSNTPPPFQAATV